VADVPDAVGIPDAVGVPAGGVLDADVDLLAVGRGSGAGIADGVACRIEGETGPAAGLADVIATSG
jgi:hypothetical protein